uniref:Uncharacterized protein n=1 Tax=Physcomitrium patens TaxID=3218 RepID=A0A2K1IB69_PHYPA|nr:hypothetical protein PHYPA_031089 [Physcomitrium patens]
MDRSLISLSGHNFRQPSPTFNNPFSLSFLKGEPLSTTPQQLLLTSFSMEGTPFIQGKLIFCNLTF